MPNRIREGHPYNPPIPGKIGARHTLLVEIYMAFSMITIGYSGQVGGDGSGALHRCLEHLGLDDIWGYSFCLIGILMVQGAFVEFIWGRHWEDAAIQRAAQWRKFCSFAATILWLVALYLQLTTPLRTFISMLLMSPINIALSGYIFWETARVHFFIGTFHASRAR